MSGSNESKLAPLRGLTRRARRVHQAIALRAPDLGLRALAATGDPVAAFVAPRGSEDDTYELIERIRETGPLTHSRAGLVAITARDLCDTVLRDRRCAVRDSDGRKAVPDRGLPESSPLSGSFLELDPPDHTRLRSLAAPAFRPKILRDNRDRIEAIADDLLDGLERRRAFDLMKDFAAPLSVRVISTLFGVPDANIDRLTRMSLIAGQTFDGVRTLQQADELRAVSDELYELFAQLIEQRRARPRDDVLSLLVAAHDDGVMTEAELIGVCGLLLLAGFETTLNLIGSGTAALLAEREHWERLVDEPLIAAKVVEETLRYEPPVQITPRIVRESLDLDGGALAPGTVVGAVLAGANRDPASYRNPHRFVLDREGEPEHLAFGAGIHYCLGAPLARMEGQVAFETLSRRFPRLRLRRGAVRRKSRTIRGFARLPVHV